jgi:aspartyl-tRNA(Asn)/glutamyl-tRNA(Gln) amidotransferase subunit C
MAITQKDVEHVAGLARLALTAEQKKKFTKELAQILEFVSQLQKVDTENVKETAHSTGLINVVRPDVPEKGLTREAFLEGAPDQHDHQLKVKGIFS